MFCLRVHGSGSTGPGVRGRDRSREGGCFLSVHGARNSDHTKRREAAVTRLLDVASVGSCGTSDGESEGKTREREGEKERTGLTKTKSWGT